MRLGVLASTEMRDARVAREDGSDLEVVEENERAAGLLDRPEEVVGPRRVTAGRRMDRDHVVVGHDEVTLTLRRAARRDERRLQADAERAPERDEEVREGDAVPATGLERLGRRERRVLLVLERERLAVEERLAEALEALALGPGAGQTARGERHLGCQGHRVRGLGGRDASARETRVPALGGDRVSPEAARTSSTRTARRAPRAPETRASPSTSWVSYGARVREVAPVGEPGGSFANRANLAHTRMARLSIRRYRPTTAMYCFTYTSAIEANVPSNAYAAIESRSKESLSPPFPPFVG